MEKYVITIAREYGSGGRGIAHRLAEALGIRYYDKELIRMASEDSGISEALFNLTDEKLEDKFLRKHGIAKGTLVSQPQPDRLTKEELFQFQSEIIRRLADGRIVYQDFVAKPCGITVGQFLPDAVQEGVGIVVEDIVVPYEGHLTENAYSYLTSVLSQYTTNRCRPPEA